MPGNPDQSQRQSEQFAQAFKLIDAFNIASDFAKIELPADESRDVESTRMYWTDYIKPLLQELGQASAFGNIEKQKNSLQKIAQELRENKGFLIPQDVDTLWKFILDAYKSVFEQPAEPESPEETLQETIEETGNTPPSPPEDGTPELQRDNEDNEHPDPNIREFIRLGRSRVPHFLMLRDSEEIWQEINIYKETYTPEERQKILEDLHWLFMSQADIIFDDIAKDRESYAVPTSKRIRVKGQWDQSGQGFFKSPAGTATFIPNTLDDWNNAFKFKVSGEFENLFEIARSWLRSFVENSNQAKHFLEVLPSSGKADDDSVIKAFGADNVSYSLERQMELMVGGRFRNESGQYSSEARIYEEFNRAYGSIHELTLHLFHLAHLKANLTINGIEYSIPSMFPHDKGTNPEASLAVIERIIRASLGPDIIENFTDRFGGREEAERMFSQVMKWAIQGAFDTTWGFGLGFDYDTAALRSTFAEGANSGLYHDHNELGQVLKTPYDQGDSSKNKSPATCERAIIYPNVLETVYVPVIIRRTDVEIGLDEEAIRAYFEEYLPSRYGNEDEIRNSQEWRAILGRVPRSVFLTQHNPPSINYRALSEHFFVLRAKTGVTKSGVQGDALILEKNNSSILRGSLDDPFFTLRLTAYDAMYRLMLPKLSDSDISHDPDQKKQNPISLFRWNQAPENIKINYNDILNYEKLWFMNSYSLSADGIIADNLRDLVEWEIDKPRTIISVPKTLMGTFRSLSKYWRGGARKFLGFVFDVMTKFDNHEDGSTEDESETVTVIQEMRRYTDIGAWLFDLARDFIRIQPDTVAPALRGSGLARIDDQLKKYYLKGYLENQSKEWAVPVTANNPEGATVLQGIEIERDPKNDYAWPLAFRHLYRTPFVPWFKHPNFASERSFYWQKIADQGSSVDYDKRRKAWFALVVDQIMFGVVSAHLGQFMYEYQSVVPKGDTQLEAVMDSYHQEVQYRRPINNKLAVQYAEDVQIPVHLFVAEVESLAARFVFDDLREYPTPERIRKFLTSLTTPGYTAQEKSLGAMSLSRDNLFDLFLALYSLKNISSGPAAAGTALDFITATLDGKTGPRKKTQEQVEIFREENKASIWSTVSRVNGK